MSDANAAAFGGQVDDAEAIYVYMKNATPKTDSASTMRAQFLTWYQNSSWYNKNFDTKWYDELRSRRNAFNLANAVTPQQKAQVEQILTKGLTAEEMQGKARPKIDVKTGMVGKSISNPPVMIAPGLKRNLKKGLQGEDVKQWQTFLGLTPATGYFDALTDTRTREYQKKNALVVDGIVGKNTWSAAFPIQKAPFAPPPTVTSSPPALTSTAKVPPRTSSSTPKPQAAKPVASSPPKSSGTKAQPSSGGSGGAPAASVPAPLPVTAGLKSNLLGSIAKWPVWAKALGIVGTIGLATGGVVVAKKLGEEDY
jgi:peptidoglycan hydrolase-like protein with peptidoglycan-binding domain